MREISVCQRKLLTSGPPAALVRTAASWNEWRRHRPADWMALMTQAPAEIVEQERRLRRDLGFPGLTAIGFSNIVGSGWLFAAMYAAQIAGPAALLSWIGAGVLCALIALV